MARNMGVDGLMSGINTTSLIEQLMSVERRPLVLAQAKMTNLKAKADAWRDVNSRLYNLQTKVNDLKSSLTYRGRKTTLGTEEFFTATAASNAAESSYQVEVKNLAKAHVIASRSDLSSSNVSLGYEGTFQINGQSVSVNTIDTLSSIADKINNTADIGVKASVIKLADNQYQMTLTSNKTGSVNSIVAEDGGDVLKNLGILDESGNIANNIQNAEDAQIMVNGLTVNRSSNTINDVIAGVTLNLKKAGGTTLNVAQDYDKIVEAVKGFVNQYNSAMSFIQDAMAFDSKTQIKGPLFGESSLLYIQSEIRSFLSKTVPSVKSEVNQLAMIGITTGAYNSGIDISKAGNLVLDETKLKAALESNFDDVMKLFGAKVNNVASSANGATIMTSSQYSAQFSSATLIDGRTGSEDWGQGGGWMDSTPGEFPDWVEISFNGSKTVDSINIYTLNSQEYPAGTYGVRNLTFEYWDETSASWKTLKTAEDNQKDLTVTDNTKGMISLSFSSVTTSKVRVNILESNGENDYSRLTEVQVYEKNDGIFSNLYNKLWDLTRTEGVIKTRQEAIGTEEKNVNKRIERLEQMLERKEEAYRARFIAMEQALAKIQTQSAWLTSQLANMSNTTTNNS